MTKKKKILIIVSCVLLATVLIYSAAWYVNYIKYDKWEKKLGYCVKHMKYVLKEDDYMYSVAKPTYPCFTGNLGISQAVSDENKVGFDVIIWPKAGGKNEIGVIIKETKYNEATGEFETTGYEVMLDGNKNLMTNEEHLLEIYKENYDELEKLYDKANELWGIFE